MLFSRHVCSLLMCGRDAFARSQCPMLLHCPAEFRLDKFDPWPGRVVRLQKNFVRSGKPRVHGRYTQLSICEIQVLSEFNAHTHTHILTHTHTPCRDSNSEPFDHADKLRFLTSSHDTQISLKTTWTDNNVAGKLKKKKKKKKGKSIISLNSQWFFHHCQPRVTCLY